MKSTDVRSGWLWLFFLVFTLTVFALTPSADAARAKKTVGTDNCIACHQSWQDNNPPLEDVVSGNAQIDYLPVNFVTGDIFYSIPGAYAGSLHSSPSFDPFQNDRVTCEGCHGSGIAHFGLGPIPNPMPQTSTCISCHTGEHFDSPAFQVTSHANANNLPRITFDQTGKGKKQATIKNPELGKISLEKANGAIVTKSERIEECSTCHSYALQYPQLKDKIANGTFKKSRAEVGCGACHDSHIPAPNANDLAPVTSVQVTSMSGSTVTGVAQVVGREVSYLNHKPYKIDETGAQSTEGTWTRGSTIARPSRAIVSGTGTLGDSGAISNRLTFAPGGLLRDVKPLLEAGRTLTLLISGTATGTGNLPADAGGGYAGAPVTVQATLATTGGFEVEEVLNDTTLVIKTRTETDSTTNPVMAQLGNADIAVVAKASVTYKKASGTATLSVFAPFRGPYYFEIRDMQTNTESLCGSCHTQGKSKYTAKGVTKGGTEIDLSSTHNKNVMGQYKNSGHADYKHALAWAEFSAFDYGSSHQASYPYDGRITGSTAVGSIRNKGITSFELTSTPNASNAYLSAAGNTTLPAQVGSSACNQCHHGLGSIDYQLMRQGTPDAQVLWGDATVTCITCHDPHADGAGKNIRVPVNLSIDSNFTGGGTNRMLDGTPIPDNVGTGIICLFCHQGRQSGFTAYKYILTRGVADPYATPATNLSSGTSSRNSHYLAGGAVLWSKNAYEYFFGVVAQTYTSGNTSHQSMNCAGCHMGEANAENTEGGHTWKPRMETCQSCHPGMTDYKTYENLNGNDYDGDGTVEPTAQEIDGLIGLIKAAFVPYNINYDPDTNPYFFAITGSTITWNTNTLTAAFNLNEMFKTKDSIYVHNPMYTIQVLRDSLQAITGKVPAGVRPVGDRLATDYRTITP